MYPYSKFSYTLLAILAVSGTNGALMDTRQSDSPPTVKALNGSYYGIHNVEYNQDFFLGIPYSQPPVGDLRFRQAQPLNSTWNDVRNATEYSPLCYGYASDDWVLGNPLSEDCLTLNVVRPAGVHENLPVAVWIFGGGFITGGSGDPRYNLSFIVQQSVYGETPFIGVSINYRLQAWGFLFGQEVLAAGSANMGVRDQRLALQWIQENIGAFGGDPTKVTIWGESAGAGSVGVQLIAYGGRDDKLFRGAISESGAPTGIRAYLTPAQWQPFYDNITAATNCSSASDTLACLRTIPAGTLSDIFNSSVTANAPFNPQIDGDFIPESNTALIQAGKFVKVPYINGANHDEGTAFGAQGIDTDEQFLAMVQSAGPDNATATTLAALYPDIPEIGIPGTLMGRPPPSQASLGFQWKRSASYGGDTAIHAARRLVSRTWAKYNATTYSYLFNVRPNGFGPTIGATHFTEVAFVFHNLQGVGYNTSVAVDPFAGVPETYVELATIMSRMWASFIATGDPNRSKGNVVSWPKYNLDCPQNIVFDANVTGLVYTEPDIYRAEGIKYISDRFVSVYGK